MADRETSQWVDVDRLVPHPDNPNSMSEETFQKVKCNIEDTGQIEPITVRDLQSSHKFTELLEEDKLQILNGEHRWRISKQLGASEVEVRIWRGVCDARAKALLLTLNRLQGEDDKKKRSALIRDLAELESHDTLATILPETEEVISRIMEEVVRPAVENVSQRAKQVGRQEPLTVFAMPEQSEAIRRAMKSWLDANDPDRMITECREGAALAAICGAYLDSS